MAVKLTVGMSKYDPFKATIDAEGIGNWNKLVLLPRHVRGTEYVVRQISSMSSLRQRLSPSGQDSGGIWHFHAFSF
jgi:hypothetical protein